MRGSCSVRSRQPRRLSWVHAVADETGKAVKHPMAQALPLLMLATIELEDQGAVTKMTLTKTPFEATADEVEAFREMIPSFTMGWSGNLDVLDEFLGGQALGQVWLPRAGSSASGRRGRPSRLYYLRRRW